MGGSKRVILGTLTVLGILFLTSLAFAAVVVTRTDFTTNAFNHNEDISLAYNITVNNTVASLANAQVNNITQVNITLPSSFVLLANTTNSTHGSGSFAAFSITGLVLSWTNSTAGVINASVVGTNQTFGFNATALTPGIYNITVVATNWTNVYNSNLTVRINDTTMPLVYAENITLAHRINVSGIIMLNTSVLDNSIVNTVLFNLTNASGMVRIFNTSNTGNYWNRTFNTADFADGVYNLTVLANDTFGGNLNNSARIEIVIDNTAPSASASCSPAIVNEEDTVTCSCSGTDATSGVATSPSSSTPSTEETGTFTFSCSVSDYSGNSASTTTTYTVESSGGGGGGGNGPSLSPVQASWRPAVIESDQNLVSKGTVTRSLGARERVQVKIADVIHHVGVVSVSSTSAVIEISSTPQQSTFTLGETKKFEVSGDNYYDLEVTLVSIAGGKAQVSMRQINEIIPSVEESVESAVQDNTILKPTRSALWGWVAGFIAVGGLVGCVLYLRNRR